jgi:SWI/SNF-related matrix-associated actin-dependent regulator of chromatin subfamily A3
MAPAAAAATTNKPVTASVCTLVVCPVSVMSNWVQQVEAHVKPGTLRVALYHGTSSTNHHLDLDCFFSFA